MSTIGSYRDVEIAVLPWPILLFFQIPSSLRPSPSYPLFPSNTFCFSLAFLYASSVSPFHYFFFLAVFFFPPLLSSTFLFRYSVWRVGRTGRIPLKGLCYLFLSSCCLALNSFIQLIYYNSCLLRVAKVYAVKKVFTKVLEKNREDNWRDRKGGLPQCDAGYVN
ncbi:hypothetical protein L873DRAFT_393727 [Choiromyces venosus 120613-1]|uniref:Transmembrane protein n=1 Tax=Choiromyces venosus 120613-1 TaxID=1336337 RepID=A0A3N4J0W6_9PEZI|nr:hypothetical protein L873DRAFT_393727 [Choiromyces venosus 120613-1]